MTISEGRGRCGGFKIGDMMNTDFWKNLNVSSGSGASDIDHLGHFFKKMDGKGASGGAYTAYDEQKEVESERSPEQEPTWWKKAIEYLKENIGGKQPVLADRQVLPKGGKISKKQMKMIKEKLELDGHQVGAGFEDFLSSLKQGFNKVADVFHPITNLRPETQAIADTVSNIVNGPSGKGRPRKSGAVLQVEQKPVINPSLLPTRQNLPSSSMGSGSAQASGGKKKLPIALQKWQSHLKECRSKNPGKSLKECMIMAKGTYKK